jgi:hypothetical protein
VNQWNRDLGRGRVAGNGSAPFALPLYTVLDVLVLRGVGLRALVDSS